MCEKLILTINYNLNSIIFFLNDLLTIVFVFDKTTADSKIPKVEFKYEADMCKRS